MRGDILLLCLCLSTLLSLGLSESKSRHQELEETTPTVCVSTVCYSLQRQSRKFNMARNMCKNGGGDAMTITSTVAADALSMLLPSGTPTAGTQNFWIGLQLHQRSCPQNDSLLWGYRWLDDKTGGDYAKWTAVPTSCGPRCVTVSAGSRAWTDRACNVKADGVLCEYRYAGSCGVLRAGEGTVTYATPFGVNSSQLSELPPGTVAWAEPWEIRFQCTNLTWTWQPLDPPTGPWSCRLENGGCQHNCQEEPAGTPRCSCRPGYQLRQDGRGCQVFDPCQDGYRLDNDSKICVDVDECQVKLCDQLCINSPGSYSCDCQPGYQLGSDNKCQDINECTFEKCEHRCSNTIGSFSCSCYNYYQPDPEDFTKCVVSCDTDPCDARCVGDDCNCPTGYIINDATHMCFDIDECESNPCDEECTNTFGSYKCDCKEGFELQEDGTSCEAAGSGDGQELVTQAPVPASSTPTGGHSSQAGLSLGVVLGSIFAVAVLTLVFAGLGHHLLTKRGKWRTPHGAYKPAELKQDVTLDQVTSGCQSEEKSSVPT
ncbi:thrombomodulin [Mustelus asterias]